ncbi:aspartate racemase [mine drainage metagenome]|uniref:Aspartate racemase n=1 Tax=mine drainage metagenome TaxID=410659 RepID=A0A1J5SHX9_9ZZZZ
MKRIGLIGGMSWESTAVYYRLINQAVRRRHGGLHSADLLLHSVNFAEIVACQTAGRWDQAADLLTASARHLEQAGADMVLICTNTMHLVADAVAAALSVPLLNIIDATGAAVRRNGCAQPLLLATRYTMEQGFYADRMARQGLTLRIPAAAERQRMHDIIFQELCHGVIREESRRAVLDIIARHRAEGADSVILGCTEICLLIEPQMQDGPLFDSTALHADAAVALALA